MDGKGGGQKFPKNDPCYEVNSVVVSVLQHWKVYFSNKYDFSAIIMLCGLSMRSDLEIGT